MNREMIEELDRLHQEEKHEEIIEKITSLEEKDKNAEILGKLARANSNLGNFSEALKILKGIEKEEGETSLWNYRMGHQYFSLEDYENARKYLEKSFQLNPEEPDVALLLCYTYEYFVEQAQKENQVEKALEYCEKVKSYAEYDQNIEEQIWVESRLAWIYDRIGDFAQGKIHLDLLNELYPEKDSWFYGEMGYNARGRFQYQEAVECYEKSIRLKEEEKVEINAWLYGELGWAYSCMGENEKGIEYLSKGAELDSKDGWIISRLGYVLGRAGYIEEGMERLKESLTLEEVNFVLVYSELGWLCNEVDLYEEGLEYLLEAEKLGRQDEWLNTEIGQCLARLGRYPESLERLQKSFDMEEESTTDYTFLHSELAWVYGKLERYEEALESLKKAKELGREDAWLYSEMAFDLSMYENRLEEALQCFQQALALGREDTWIHGQMGHLYTRLGRMEEAVESFRLAREQSPYDSWILYHLGKSLRMIGEIPEAIEVLQKEIEVSQFKGWGDLELAWCYALVDEKEKAEESLKNVEEYLSSQFTNDESLRQDYNTVKELLSFSTYLA